MLEKISYWKRLLPIVFFLAYLNFTVFLFAYGPWDWPVQNGGKLYVFLSLAHLFLFLGYLSAAFNQPRAYYGKWSIGRLMKFTLILNLLLLLPTSLSRSGSLIPNIGEGLNNLGAAYMYSNAMRLSTGGNIAEYTRIIFSPILALLIPLTFYYWNLFNTKIKLFSLASMVGFIAIYIAIGTNKALADFVLIVPWLFVARYCTNPKRYNWKYVISLSVTAALGIGLFFTFFSASIVSRMENDENAITFPIVNINADRNNFLVKHLPTELQVGFISLASYLTQGY